METNRKKAKLFVQPKIFSKYYYALIDGVISIHTYTHTLEFQLDIQAHIFTILMK